MSSAATATVAAAEVVLAAVEQNGLALTKAQFNNAKGKNGVRMDGINGWY